MDVKAIIKEKGWTQERVAQKMGITRVTLAQNLERNPTMRTLKRVAQVLKCNVGEFFKDEIEIKEEPADTIICPHCGKPIKFTKEEQ